METSLFTPQTAIITARSLREIIQHAQSADADTLVIFDVDYVLTHPSEPTLQMANFIRHQEIFQKCFLSLPPEEQDIAAVMTVSTVANELVDEKILDLLNTLQVQGAKTIALTALLTSPIGNIQDMPQWRVNELARLGIDLSQAYLDLQRFTFDDLPAYQNHHPAYNNGVLFSNGEQGPTTKGKVLVHFLRRSGWIPKKILFVDDRLSNITDVQGALAAAHSEVEFIGIHYLGAAAASTPAVNQETFFRRITQLIDEARLSCARLH